MNSGVSAFPADACTNLHLAAGSFNWCDGEIKSELDMNAYLGLAVCGKQTVEFDQLKMIER